ncbi:Lon protease [Acrasis kona]|uniref:Lon protease n=1 Tax=Acrasis kona TaxID=1008807 RepID=A0AAW2YKL0_9EUKA
MMKSSSLSKSALPTVISEPASHIAQTKQMPVNEAKQEAKFEHWAGGMETFSFYDDDFEPVWADIPSERKKENKPVQFEHHLETNFN